MNQDQVFLKQYEILQQIRYDLLTNKEVTKRRLLNDIYMLKLLISNCRTTRDLSPS